MLETLTVQDVVTVRHLHLSFSEGLTLLTGETGAGKSILIDALGLALGARAESKLVRQGSKRASVTASFSLPSHHPAHRLLESSALEAEDLLILKRVLSPDGRSRALVNDQPVSVTFLRTLGSHLVDIQGQFSQHGLLDSGSHGAILDTFGALKDDALACARTYEQWKAAENLRDKALQRLQNLQEEETLLRHTKDELERLATKEGEEKTLLEQRSLLKNREKIAGALAGLFTLTQGEHSLDDLLRRAEVQAGTLQGHGLPYLSQGLDKMRVELEDVMATLNTLADQIDTSHEPSLDTLEERLFLLRELGRKHGVEPDALPGVLEETSHKLLALEDTSAQGDEHNHLCDLAKQAYEKAAHTLSQKRRNAALRLDTIVNQELPTLKLEKAHFVTQCTPSPPSATGCDRVTFTCATNPGTAPVSLADGVSGGELSRILLALNVALSHSLHQGVSLVFDEVDSGVSGSTASAIGQRLGRLSQTCQVLVVTHSPQVAACGRTHWTITKAQEEGMAITEARLLTEEQRCEEVARMLSGHRITQEARQQALRLLEEHS